MQPGIEEKLRGIFAPIATPFQDNEDLDTDALSHNLALYESTPLRGYLVLGSNGENKSLDESERLSVFETVTESMSERRTTVVGVMYEAYRHAERHIRQVANLGADFALIQSPSYFKKMMTDEALYAWFCGLADSSPIPVLVYNCPGFNGITLSFGLLEKLSGHPNIVGMKDSTPGCELNIMRLNSKSFHVMAGSIGKISDFVQHGSIGGTVSLANYCPALAVELYDCLQAQEPARCADLNRKLVRANKAISGGFGVPGVKAAMNLTGFRAGIPRRPLMALQPADIETIESILTKIGALRA